jgi:FtsP/CotA-like multicopper oxidase with cupredoxin domain
MLTGALFVTAAIPSEGATPVANEGIECTPGSGSYTLTAKTGRITMPDGNSLFSWGYGTPTRTFSLPGPTICVTVGTTVTISLTNNLSEDTSLVFPGQENVLADGQPSLPAADLSSGRVTSLAPVATANGGTMTYSFVATKPGTFLYESGTDVDKQVEMGLFGGLIVRPTTANQAYDDPSTAYEPNREYLHIFSQVDPALHLAVEKGKTFDWSTYSPKYFLLNGRSAPDTVSPNNAAWLPNQPMGSMVHVRPQLPAGMLPSEDAVGAYDHAPALVRYINLMGTDVAFHPHGNTERVIAEDGQSFAGLGGLDKSFGKFLVDVGANRTADALFTWTDVEKYHPTENPIPVALAPYQDQLISGGTWYAMSPYLGQTGELPQGVTSFNQCGEYYHMAHNHALQRATNYGASFGGQMTLIRIDPPAGCPAP